MVTKDMRVRDARRYAAEPVMTTGHSAAVEEFARAVVLGLSDRPRWLPCRYLYDERGSELFVRITQTPEYYLTRTETAILAAAAPEIRELTGPRAVVELGSGTAAKTGLLLDAYARTNGHGPTTYVPVDVSSDALDAATTNIARAYPGVRVRGVHGPYEAAFPLLRGLSPAMLVFLGSSIGNFNQTEALAFWTHVRRALHPGGFVLLGVDLVKDQAVLNAAYNDAAGYSAAFTLNLFTRINRELGADLEHTALRHSASYNEAWRRIEIFAEFDRAQTNHVRPLERTLRVSEGERVMTEVSRKFVVGDLEEYLSAFGLETRRVFADPRNWYAVLLLERVPDA